MTSDFHNFPLRFPQDFNHGIEVVLFEPEIPLNAGSTARTCAVTKTPLNLVGTLGFFLDNRLAKRAGLDYWEHADVSVHNTWNEFRENKPDSRMICFTTKGDRSFWDIEYCHGDILVFGPERSGLPDEILNTDGHIRASVPMVPEFRSLNLSNTVAIALYEVLRQRFVSLYRE